MVIRVIRNGAEIFNATGYNPVLNFPVNTRVQSVESTGDGVRVFLAETPAEAQPDMQPSYAERVLVGSGKFIYAIKSYRTRTGCNLRDAKVKMDELRADMEREGERY